MNYFNYFTETEEHFQRARGTSLFLLSPLDWALIETWSESGVPLEAVLRGIDAAFEKWRSRKVKTQMVNSLAFCAQAVLTEAQIMAGLAQPKRETAPPFPLDALCAYLESNAAAVPYPEIADWWRRMQTRPSVKSTIFDRMSDADWAPFKNLAPDPWPKVQTLLQAA